MEKMLLEIARLGYLFGLHYRNEQFEMWVAKIGHNYGLAPLPFWVGNSISWVVEQALIFCTNETPKLVE